jgi:hypothetical protein
MKSPPAVDVAPPTIPFACANPNFGIMEIDIKDLLKKDERTIWQVGPE